MWPAGEADVTRNTDLEGDVEYISSSSAWDRTPSLSLSNSENLASRNCLATSVSSTTCHTMSKA